MRSHARRTVQLGVLVAAAFDKAARYSADPREVSHQATQAVAHMLRGARRLGRIGASPARSACGVMPDWGSRASPKPGGPLSAA